MAGERGVARLVQARRFVGRHWPVIVAGVALAAGLFVTALGVTGLAAAGGGDVGRAARRARGVLTHPGGH